MAHQRVTGEPPTIAEPPSPPKARSPATSGKVNRAKSQAKARDQKNYRKLSGDSTSLKAVATFFAYDGQRCLGVVRDLVTKVEAVNLAGRSLGFFGTRSEALRAFGGAS